MAYRDMPEFRNAYRVEQIAEDGRSEAMTILAALLVVGLGVAAYFGFSLFSVSI